VLRKRPIGLRKATVRIILDENARSHSMMLMILTHAEKGAS
jgi:hypothetical protein